MTWKINGVTVSETSKVSSNTVWGTGNKMSGVQLNVCYTYDISYNGPPPDPPPAPPPPPQGFSWTDCDGNSQGTSLEFGQSQQICAIVDSVTGDGDISNTNTRCS